MATRVIQVIETDLEVRGCGVTYCKEHHEHQPARRIIQYWTFEGELLAERDPWKKEQIEVKATKAVIGRSG